MTDKIIIEQTRNWIKNVVVDCNFCPFAAKALLRKSIHYSVLPYSTLKNSLEVLLKELQHLDVTDELETTFIIFPVNYKTFASYLRLITKGEEVLTKNSYDGIYQLASFHPLYRFAGSSNKDAANYTNRSVYPMLHILREDSITKALVNFSHPETIPQRNIDFARQKGLNYMQLLRAASMV